MRRTEPIQVRFDRPVVSEDRVGVPLTTQLFVVSPPMDGETRFAAPDLLELRPERPFLPATRYRVVVRPEAVGGDLILVGSKEFRFRTPLFGLEDVRLESRRDRLHVTLRFSHPVQSVEVDRAVMFEDDVGGYVRAERRTDATTRNVTFRFPFDLAQLEERPLRLRIDGSLRPVGGGSVLGKTVERRLGPESGRSMRVVRLEPVQRGVHLGVDVETTQPVQLDSLADHFEASTKPEWIARTPSGAFVAGRFEGQVSVGPGLRSQTGEVSTDGRTAQLPTPSPQPAVVIAGGGAQGVEVRSRGVSRLRVIQRSVSRPNVVASLRQVSTPGERAFFEGRTAWEAAVGEAGITWLQLRSDAEVGRVELEVADADRPWIRSRRVLDRWRLRLVAKQDGRALWVVAADPESGPLSGVDVEIRSDRNVLLGSARTDGQGIARFDSPELPFAVVAHRGSRFAVLPLDDAHRRVGPGGSGLASAEMWGQLQPDGASARVWLFASDDEGPAAGRQVQVGPRNRPWAVGETDRLGLFAFDAPLGFPLRPGQRTVPVRLDGQTVRPRLRVPVPDRSLDLKVEIAGGGAEPFRIETRGGEAPIQGRARCLIRNRDLGTGGTQPRVSGWRGPWRRVRPGDRIRCPLPAERSAPGAVGLQVEMEDGRGAFAAAESRVPHDAVRFYPVIRVGTGSIAVAAVDPEGEPRVGPGLTLIWEQVEGGVEDQWDDAHDVRLRRPVRSVRELQRQEVPAQAGWMPVAPPVRQPGMRLRVELPGTGSVVRALGTDAPGALPLTVLPRPATVGLPMALTPPSGASAPWLVSVEREGVLDLEWIENGSEAVDALYAPGVWVVSVGDGTPAASWVPVQGTGPEPQHRVSVLADGRIVVRRTPRESGPAWAWLGPPPDPSDTEEPDVGPLGVTTFADPGPKIRVPMERPTVSPREAGAPPIEPRPMDRDGYAIFSAPGCGTRRFEVRSWAGQRMHRSLHELDLSKRPQVRWSAPPVLVDGETAAVDLELGCGTGSVEWKLRAEDGRVVEHSATGLTRVQLGPGAWSVAAVSAGAVYTARFQIARRPPVYGLTSASWSAGYGRPAQASDPGGAAGWLAVGPSPAWSHLADLVELERSDAPGHRVGRAWARLALEPKAWSALAQVLAVEPAESGPEADSEPLGRWLSALARGARSAAAGRWSGAGWARSAKAAAQDPARVALIDALLQGADGAGLDALRPRLEDPASIGLWLALRSRASAAAPYWGSIQVDGQEWIRFNSRRPLLQELPASARSVSVRTTGAGTAYGSWIGWGPEVGSKPWARAQVRWVRPQTGQTASTVPRDGWIRGDIALEREGPEVPLRLSWRVPPGFLVGEVEGPLPWRRVGSHLQTKWLEGPGEARVWLRPIREGAWILPPLEAVRVDRLPRQPLGPGTALRVVP